MKAKRHHGRTEAAFTLVELVAVMAVMAAILMTAVASYPSWGRIHAMRSAESLVMGELQRARQLAITQNRHVRLGVTNSVPESPRLPYGRIFLACSDPDDAKSEGSFPVTFGKTNDLPRGVFFVLSKDIADDPSPGKAERPSTITFKPDGSCAIGGDWRNEGAWCDADSDALDGDRESSNGERVFVIRYARATGKADGKATFLSRAFAVNRLTGLARVVQTSQEE